MPSSSLWGFYFALTSVAFAHRQSFVDLGPGAGYRVIAAHPIEKAGQSHETAGAGATQLAELGCVARNRTPPTSELHGPTEQTVTSPCTKGI